jgi:folate-dependent phosphoribosylglycinamide formyltransferase PurN
VLDRYDIDLIVMAGLLQKYLFPERFKGRVLNIHPGLLPRYGGLGMYGHHVHEAVLAAGDTESGLTVHIADDEYDHGPIVLQRKVPVLPGDTPETLAERVFEAECEAYPEAVRLMAAQLGLTTPA